MQWHRHELCIRAKVELFGTYFRLAENLHLVWLFEQLIIELTQVVRHRTQLSLIVRGGSSQLILQCHCKLNDQRGLWFMHGTFTIIPTWSCWMFSLAIWRSWAYLLLREVLWLSCLWSARHCKKKYNCWNRGHHVIWVLKLDILPQHCSYVAQITGKKVSFFPMYRWTFFKLTAELCPRL